MQHSESAVSPLVTKSRQALKAAQTGRSEDLMPVKAAAVALDVSEMTIRRALEAGDFPGIQISRTYRVSRPFVEAVLAEVRAGRRVIVEEFAAQWPSRAQEGAA